jgi:LytS/YehU family sensor histidine kinase
MKYTFLSKIGIAIVVALLYKLLFFGGEKVFGPDLFLNTLMVLMVWQGNIQIDKWLNARYAWVENPKKRLTLQIVACTLFTTVTLFVIMYILHQMRFGDGRIINRKMTETFIPILSITYVVLSINISRQFFNAMKDSLLEVEKYKTESANAQLQNLKNQLNPHFLFNNLSVLTSLVYKDQDKAVDFINELSKVYRYVLDNKSSELVSLQEELDFLAHYIYLLKIRFGDNISFSIKIGENTEGGYLPPMCLQMLVENTIQHNEASQANPLKVLIYTENNHLIVENAIQPRSDKTESSQTGLKNIQSRYAFFITEKVEILNDSKVFKVVLPLIFKNESRHS